MTLLAYVRHLYSGRLILAGQISKCVADGGGWAISSRASISDV